jgi:hypothetical protein
MESWTCAFDDVKLGTTPSSARARVIASHSRAAHEVFSRPKSIDLASPVACLFVGVHPASASFFGAPIDTPKWLVMDDYRLSAH